MQYLRELQDWRTLSWWLAVLGVAVMIKQQYSTATVAELDWILRPLSLLLEWISGHSFHRDMREEWVSVSADVRLVKACSGINFMLMSLLAWAWVFRSEPCKNADFRAWIAVRMLLLFAVCMAAWSTSLLANSLRILVAMHLPDHGVDLHRLNGMMIYVPLLSIQLLLGNRRSWEVAIAGPVLLYFILMALAPTLTGNAFRNPAQFIDHLLYLLAMAAIMVGIYRACLGFERRRRPGMLSGSENP